MRINTRLVVLTRFTSSSYLADGYPGSGMKRGIYPRSGMREGISRIGDEKRDISPIGDEKRDGKHVLTKS
jgi:hypothetical protein